jgi:uncharacterized protein (DUF2384 family)
MAAIQPASVLDRLPSTPGVAWWMARIQTRAEAMGLLGPGPHIRRLDPSAFLTALDALVAEGVGRSALAALEAGADPEAALASLDEALAASPVPEREWPALAEVLGEEVTSRLVGVSSTSARRYRVGARTTPDEVAERLHYLALVVADLAGAYNSTGIRRWFSRPRPQLGGRAPVELLTGEWAADDPGPRAVAELAAALVGAGSAT